MAAHHSTRPPRATSEAASRLLSCIVVERYVHLAPRRSMPRMPRYEVSDVGAKTSTATASTSTIGRPPDTQGSGAMTLTADGGYVAARPKTHSRRASCASSDRRMSERKRRHGNTVQSVVRYGAGTAGGVAMTPQARPQRDTTSSSRTATRGTKVACRNETGARHARPSQRKSERVVGVIERRQGARGIHRAGHRHESCESRGEGGSWDRDSRAPR